MSKQNLHKTLIHFKTIIKSKRELLRFHQVYQATHQALITSNYSLLKKHFHIILRIQEQLVQSCSKIKDPLNQQISHQNLGTPCSQLKPLQQLEKITSKIIIAGLMMLRRVNHLKKSILQHPLCPLTEKRNYSKLILCPWKTRVLKLALPIMKSRTRRDMRSQRMSQFLRLRHPNRISTLPTQTQGRITRQQRARLSWKKDTSTSTSTQSMQ